MRVILPTLLLLSIGHCSYGQGTAPTGETKTKLSFSGPSLPVPLIGLVNSLPQQRASLDDSLARCYYARNHVKTVAMVRVSATGMALDTLDYTELDRAGYPILTAKPIFQVRTHLRYNRRHQLISLTKEVQPGFDWVLQTDYDPTTQTTITRVGRTLATLALYQTGHSSQHGKNSSHETLLMAVPSLPAPTVSRVLVNISALGGDTIRLDVLGYQGDQVVTSEAYYAIGRQPQQREGGTIVLPTAGRSTKTLEGKFIPNQRSTFDAAGRLSSIQYLPAPLLLADRPVTQTSPDGQGSMTIKQSTDTLTTTYLRNADGQLLREEFHGKMYTNYNTSAGPPYNAYDYLPNGLRRSKTDNHGTHYAYRYTFY